MGIPICFLLISLLLPSAAAGCSPSSCGHLSDIHHPFRLQTDPSECGLEDFQLLCDNNKPFLEIGSGKLYVNSISYVNWTIDVVDAAFKNKSCSLPTVSLPSYEILYHSGYSFDYTTKSACFVSCVKPIESQGYWNISCLSRNNTFVYAIVDRDSYRCPVKIVEPSCKFLAATLVKRASNTSTTMDIFERLQKGFVISWLGYKYKSSTLVFYDPCIKKASRLFFSQTKNKEIFSLIPAFLKSEKSYFNCMAGYYYNKHYYYAMAALNLIRIMQIVLALAVLMRCAFKPLSIYIFLAYKFWGTRVSIDNVEKFLRNQQALTPMRYSYTDLIAVTGHFREKLGQGGFGTVFKGTLLSGHHLAIKMLGDSKLNGDEFINEVSTVGRIHHINVVQLVGFCSEGSKRALVYEYMPNGSLDKYIFSAKGTSHHRPFTWEKLNDIALGIARGIDYLHRGCDMQILHFDIKPHNILLDHNFNPKVSDFGLAKLYPKDYSLVSISAARGTIGYIAPELVSRSFGVISYKSDVYSFGMLLLEMAGGRRNVDTKMENSSQIYYPSWIYDRLMQGEQQLMIENSNEIHEVERKLCLVGLWCIQMKSANRPSMSKVVEMLEGYTNCLEMPARPFFSSSQPDSVRLSPLKSITEQLSIISEQEYPSNIEA